MAQIYQSEKVKTDIPQTAFKAEQLANRGLNQKLEQEKQDAFNMYEQGLTIQASESMNSLFSEYGNDPEALSQKLGELNEKMSAEIPDAKMRVNFKTKFLISSQSMVNRAQANHDKIQFEKKRSSYFNTVYANNKNIQLAFENAFSGTATPDDLVNYQMAVNQNKALINAQNEDGTFMFSDAQRLAMSRDVDEIASKSFVSSLMNMDDDKRAQFLANLDADNVIMLSAEDEDKNIRQLNLKDVVDADVYSDMKKMAKEADMKIKSQQLKEWNLNKRYSEMAYTKNPTSEGYKAWEYYNRGATEEKKASLRGLMKFTPNEDTVTIYDAEADALSDIQEVLDPLLDDDREVIITEDGKQHKKTDFIMGKVVDIVAKIRRSNERGFGEETRGLDVETMTKLEDIILGKVRNPLFSKLISNIPNVKAFAPLRIIGAISPQGREIIQGAESWYVNNKIEETANHTLRSVIGYLADAKNISTEEERVEIEKKINKTMEEGLLRAYADKYYWIDDLKKELKAGETIVNLNGINARYLGFSGGKPQFEPIK